MFIDDEFIPPTIDAAIVSCTKVLCESVCVSRVSDKVLELSCNVGWCGGIDSEECIPVVGRSGSWL